MRNQMKSKTIETEFINWFVSEHPKLNKNKILRKGPGENQTHVRFSAGCGINSESEFLKLFEDFDYSPVVKNEFSKSYTVGGYIRWDNKKVGVLYGVAKEGHSERKRWTPGALGLNGLVTKDIKTFRANIISGLKNINEVEIELFLSLLDNIQKKTPIIETTFLSTNKSKITSDFGEVLAAYEDVVNGHEIKFTNKSNQKVVDYYVFLNNKWKEVSVKNPKGGGKVNVSDYVDFIDVSDEKNMAAQILHSIGSHNRDKLFELCVLSCPQVTQVAKIIGGISKAARTRYVKTHKYDQFYDQIKSDPLFVVNATPIGIPKEQEWKLNELTPRFAWEKGSLEPLDFTLNTLISRFWGETNIDKISEILTKILTKPKFKVVDIGQHVVISEIEFADINKWKTVYWSRATKAWHNWIAVAPAKGMKNDYTY